MVFSNVRFRQRRLVFVFLCASFCSYTTPATAQVQRLSPAVIRIVVLEGDGSLNSVRARAAQDLVVRVEDEMNRPIPGASVKFELPAEGPGARFPGGRMVATVSTDTQGRARALGMQPNHVQGEFLIRVTASYQDGIAAATITQTNVIAVGSPSRGGVSKWLLVGIAGGASVGFALVQARGRSSTPSTPVQPGTGAAPPGTTAPPGIITITPGTAVVTGPR